MEREQKKPPNILVSISKEPMDFRSGNLGEVIGVWFMFFDVDD
jgi:hypothetical protein